MMRKYWFWLLNGLLILLYLWAMGEETAVSVQVKNGRCVAIVPERHIGIDCPQIGAGSQVGLFATQPSTTSTMLATYPPLRWLAPHTAWADLNLFKLDGHLLWRQRFGQMDWTKWQLISGGWQTRWGELHGLGSQNSLVLQEPVGDSFILTSHIRRAGDEAGLLLRSPQGLFSFWTAQTGAVFGGNGKTAVSPTPSSASPSKNHS